MRRFVLLTLLLLHVLAVSVCWAGNTSTSGVTAQTIIDRARANLAERTADFWTDADIVQWTNEAVREIVSQTRCLETGTSTIVLSAYGRSYPLSGLSWIDVEKVEYYSGVTSDPLQYYDLDRAPFINMRLGNEKEKGKPKVFAVWNNSVYLWPVPTSVEAGTTCFVYYVPLPSGVTSAASSIETPSYFDAAILDYVLAQAWYKAEYVTRAKFFEARFLSRIKAYLVNILRRNVFDLPQAQK